MMNPYIILGLKVDCNDAQVRQAYLHLLRTYSPEKNPEIFKKISQAYETIKTVDKRIQYLLLTEERADLMSTLKDKVKMDLDIPQPYDDLMAELRRV